MKFIPYGRQAISDADIEAVVAVLRSDYLTQGPAVDRFEQTLTSYLGAKEAIAVANGTAALHIASLALNLGPGDAVVVPPLTFAATANAVLYCGATPIFADIDPSTLTLSPASTEAALAQAKREGLRPRALYPVHYAGLPADLGALHAIAARDGLAIVEDACHALGADYRTAANQDFRKVGSGGVTSMQCWSFHPVKHVATGEGGAVTTDDPALAAALRMLRTHGITKDPARMTNKPADAAPWYMEMQLLGYNYRLCDVQAALGASQMLALPASVARRRQIAAIYRNELADLNWLRLPPGDSERGRHAYHLFPVCLDFQALGKTRTTVMQELAASKIGTQVHYIPVYQHPYYQHATERWRKVDCRHAEAFYAGALSIPMYATLSDAEVARVCAAIRSLATR